VPPAGHAIPPGQWLEQPAEGLIQAPRHLWGFGGLHGGLTLAVLTKAVQRDDSEPAVVRSVTGRFHRPITDPFTIKISWARKGRGAADAVLDDSDQSPAASSSTVSGPRRAPSLLPIAAQPPSAPPPTDGERFVVPPEFVPISVFMDIRPVGTHRPYAGGTHPELTAWLRLTEDDRPPDLYRLLLLMDALAPSYAAILTGPQLIPTVEFTVRPTDGLGRATSPWILVHAETNWASADGWVHERLDAWDPDGVHLGSADQLRTLTAGRPPSPNP
jgi:hypothetical protein